MCSIAKAGGTAGAMSFATPPGTGPAGSSGTAGTGYDAAGATPTGVPDYAQMAGLAAQMVAKSLSKLSKDKLKTRASKR